MMRLLAGLLVVTVASTPSYPAKIQLVQEAPLPAPSTQTPLLTPLPLAEAPLLPTQPVAVPAPEAPAASVQLGALGEGNAPEPQARRVFDDDLSPPPANPDESVVPGEKLSFTGVGTRDVYNPTAPFKTNFRGREHEVLAARVEDRLSEESEIIFFEKAGELWRPLAGTPVWRLQDPFFSKVNGELIVGGVQTYPRADGSTGYRTVFYRGKDLADLKPFARGPDDMKDIRLLGLANGKILVMTRPQGKIGGRGKIGMTVIDDLGHLGPEAVNRAVVFEDLFPPEQWGGANELHLLKDGHVGVLGHIAEFDAAGNRHYSPMAFTLDQETGKHSPVRVLLRRSQLPVGASKRPDLTHVLLSGGLVRREDATAVLYVGAGDAEVYRAIIADPFF